MTMVTQRTQPGKVDIIHAKPDTKPLTSIPRTPLWPCVASAVVSGILLWMCFFPLAWGWLAWVALVPLLALVRQQATPKRIYWCAWLGGTVFFWPALHWMPVNSHMIGAYVALAIYCSLYFPVAIWMIRLLERRTVLPLAISVPVVWTALEFARSYLLSGFAWYYLGHTQHTVLSLIQISDVGGVYLVSFLVAAVNAWIFDLLYQAPAVRDLFRLKEPVYSADRRPSAAGWSLRTGLIYEAGLLIVAFVSTVTYGVWRLDQKQFEEGPLLALLQTDLPQSIRDDGDARHMANQYDGLTGRAMNHYPTPDMIVWPETSYPVLWREASKRIPVEKVPHEWRREEVEVRSFLREVLLKLCPTRHLLGVQAKNLDEQLNVTRYNTALLLEKNGRFADRYDKVHPVPFGEFVPFRDSLPFLKWLSPYENDYSIEAGERLTRFELDKHKFGVLICYEDTDPFLARRYVRTEPDGAPVNFLINMSNDGWFNGSVEHEEHLAISRFRAIECRRAVARSVNMGISAVIDGNGRILKPEEMPPPGELHTWKITGNEELPVAEWGPYKKSAGVLLARIPIDRRTSFYAATGDWFSGGCAAIIGGVMGWSLVRRWRMRQAPIAA